MLPRVPEDVSEGEAVGLTIAREPGPQVLPEELAALFESDLEVLDAYLSGKAARRHVLGVVKSVEAGVQPVETASKEGRVDALRQRRHRYASRALSDAQPHGRTVTRMLLDPTRRLHAARSATRTAACATRNTESPTATSAATRRTS